MNLQQLRLLHETVRHNYNLSAVANSLHTSQPGVSKAILDLEKELGIEIFVRHGKRLKNLSPAGAALMGSVRNILQEVANIRNIAHEGSRKDSGILSIATTHTQARYILPAPIAKLRNTYPSVSVRLHQGTPDQVAKMLLEDIADIGIATESIGNYPELITLPCYDWQHLLILPPEHPLARKKGLLRLQDLADQALITYHPTFTGRTRIDNAFAQAGITPQVVLEAIDSDVIKTYVSSGLGLGIIAEMAGKNEMNNAVGTALVTRAAGHLFGINTTRVAFKRGIFLREFIYAFANYLNPKITQSAIQEIEQKNS